MIESNLILIYFSIIIILQSIIGVGVLVLGTPFLLILGYDMVEIFFILLPISIVTSFLNLLIINFFHETLDMSIFKEFKKFFIICIPSIFVGLILLKAFDEYLNFKYLVAVIIFFSVSIVLFKDKIKFRVNFFRISILSVVGMVHGLTNSGGTLMSLTLSVTNKKEYARLTTSFFYLILASFQYCLTTIIFYDRFLFPNNYKLIASIIIGAVLGNLINYYLKIKIYKLIVNLLAVLSAFILILI